MTRPVLDRDELRAYARRDWGAPERLARRERARQPVAAKVQIASALNEAAIRAVPASEPGKARDDRPTPQVPDRPAPLSGTRD